MSTLSGRTAGPDGAAAGTARAGDDVLLDGAAAAPLPRPADPRTGAVGRAARSALPLAAGVLTVLGLLPVLITSFGFLDDYSVLYLKEADPRPTVDAALVQGRPVAGLLQSAGFAVVDSIDGLALMRAFNVLCLALFAGVAVAEMLRLRYSRSVAAAFAAGLLVLPSTALMSAWAILLMGPAALLLALLAAVSFSRGLESVVQARHRPREAVRRLLPAVALLAAAVLAYQPSAMVFWPALLLFLAAPGRLTDRPLRLLGASAVALAVGAAACATGYVAVKAGVAYVGGDVPRTALTTDVAGKLDYVVAKAVPRVLDPLSLVPRPSVAWASGTGLVVALLLLPAGPVRHRLLLLLLWCSAGVLSYLPSLATAENWASARSLSAAFVVPLVGVALVLQGAVDRLPDLQWSRLARTALAGVACVAAAAWSASSLHVYWTGPQSEELQRARAVVGPALTGRPVEVVTLRSDYRQSLAPTFSYDEAGVPSTYGDWVTAPLTQLLARERTGRFLPQVRAVDREELGAVPAGVVVVDYAAVLEPALGPSVRRLP